MIFFWSEYFYECPYLCCLAKKIIQFTRDQENNSKYTKTQYVINPYGQQAHMVSMQITLSMPATSEGMLLDKSKFIMPKSGNSSLILIKISS